ncbi:hypothetical protein Barb6_02772 [Bacteroidales bacterium Barb6]|nr:hypothetical protein Barb6_02772 [Bacteroidales bacterium Barb6]
MPSSNSKADTTVIIPCITYYSYSNVGSAAATTVTDNPNTRNPVYLNLDRQCSVSEHCLIYKNSQPPDNQIHAKKGEFDCQAVMVRRL